MNENQSIVSIWKEIINNDDETWIIFEKGTCIILLEPEEDLEKQAITLLKEWGPVVPGTSLGDFNVQKEKNLPGWIVLYSHPDIANYVSPEEMLEDESDTKVYNDMIIGLIGRKKRQEDSQLLKIIHIEDRRNYIT